MNSNRLLYDTVKKVYENRTPLDAEFNGLAMEQIYKVFPTCLAPHVIKGFLRLLLFHSISFCAAIRSIRIPITSK